jgi:DNA-binding beta-propeller fold protein YncE
VYVALENGAAVQAIDTIENRVIAQISIGQTAQALVYIPNAVPNGISFGTLQDATICHRVDPRQPSVYNRVGPVR